MSLQEIKNLKDQKGFTIVELLIVIVVIGILAAIVIVAYTGITNRANDSNNKADAASLQKLAEAINADTGTYPSGTTSATLVTSFNSLSSTTQLPSGITVTYLAAGATNVPPTYSTAKTNAEATPHSYTVKVCSTSNNTTGLVIYYPIRASSSVGSLNVGTGCA